MSEVQNGRPVSHAKSGCEEFTPSPASGLVVGADGKDCAEFATDDGDDLGGHTMMCRPTASQGRRSLFRR